MRGKRETNKPTNKKTSVKSRKAIVPQRFCYSWQFLKLKGQVLCRTFGNIKDTDQRRKTRKKKSKWEQLFEVDHNLHTHGSMLCVVGGCLLASRWRESLFQDMDNLAVKDNEDDPDSSPTSPGRDSSDNGLSISRAVWLPQHMWLCGEVLIFTSCFLGKKLIFKNSIDIFHIELNKRTTPSLSERHVSPSLASG